MSTVNLAITSTPEISEALKAELEEATHSDVHVSKVSNLDGVDPDAVLHVLKIVSSLVSNVMPIIRVYLEQKKLKNIKLGDAKPIENPNQDQVERLFREFQSGSDSP